MASRIVVTQGEQRVARGQGVVISTLLGSCVGVCLHDAGAGIGGLNHFLLARPTGAGSSRSDMLRYGTHAMELLVNAMLRAGAVRTGLRAHIFGGAKMIAGMGSIGSDNAACAVEFVRAEGFALGTVDVGGTRARRIEFEPASGVVRVQHIEDRVIERPQAPPRAQEVLLF